MKRLDVVGNELRAITIHGLSDGLLYGPLDGSQLLSRKQCLAVQYDGLFGRVHVR